MSIVGVIALVIVLCQCYQGGKIKTMVASAILPHTLLVAKAAVISNELDPIKWASKIAVERMYLVLVGVLFLALYYVSVKIFKRYILYHHMLPSHNTDECTHESQLFLELHVSQRTKDRLPKCS